MNPHRIGTLHRWKVAALRWGALALCAIHLGPVPAALGQPGDHVLSIQGDGFSLQVKEPPGWFVDSTIAPQFAASAILYPVSGDPHRPGTPLIRVVVFNGTREDAGAALDRELEQYRSRYRNVKFAPTTVAHQRHRPPARRICIPNEFCDYLAYLHPRPESRILLSVTLHRPGRPAAADELAAYQRVIASLDGIATDNGK